MQQSQHRAVIVGFKPIIEVRVRPPFITESGRADFFSPLTQPLGQDGAQAPTYARPFPPCFGVSPIRRAAPEGTTAGQFPANSPARSGTRPANWL